VRQNCLRELLVDTGKKQHGFNFILQEDFIALVKKKYDLHKQQRKEAMRNGGKKKGPFTAPLSTVNARRKNVRVRTATPHHRPCVRMIVHACAWPDNVYLFSLCVSV